MRTVLTAVLFSMACTVAIAADKVALLIGNSNYSHSAVVPLPNPVNDVRALARTLETHGFEVTSLTDQSLAGMQQALRRFRAKADRAETAMVFYAGHGIEIGGVNYLIPTDATLEDERDARVEALSLDTVLHQISGARKLKMVVLDACRDNPFAKRMKTRGLSRYGNTGLAKIDAESDTLIAYAAAPGMTTPDGPPAGNSPYTKALIAALQGQALDVRRLFGTVRDNMRKSVPDAEPFLETSLGGAAYIIQKSDPVQTPKPTIAIAPKPKIQAEPQSGRTARQWSLEGDKYYFGLGVKKDHKRAFKAYRKAADQGYARAMFNLGFMYRKGLGVPQDYKAAVKWYQRSADKGDARAMNGLGFMYDNGHGVPQDYKAAVKWYQRSADKGDAAGMANLGYMYRKGLGVPQDYKTAIKWSQRSADKGDAAGMFNLGFMYRKGLGVPQDDKAAVKWYQKSADKGYAKAMNNLGYMYAHGEGVPVNEGEAYKWYKMAADRGDVTAIANLGLTYDDGKGVAHDPLKAANLLLQSLREGNANQFDSMWDGGWPYEQSTRKEIQRALRADGFYAGPINGEFGRATLNAIQAYWDKYN